MGLALRALKFAVLPYGVVSHERRPGLIVLIYHRVGGGTSSEIDLPVRVFERQMAHLSEHYSVRPLDILTGRSAVDAHGRDVVAVTFDDGCREVYDHAFPILVRYNIPATVYVITRYMESQQAFEFGGYSRSERRPSPLRWEQAREMVASGLVTIGAHSHSHEDLTRVSADTVRDEVDRCRDIIGERLGSPPRHFAYPWGVVTPDVKSIVGESFVTAVRGGCAKNPFAAVDLLALWRRPIQQSDGFWLFRRKVDSLLDGEEFFRSLAGRYRRPPNAQVRSDSGAWRTG
jgi:peptidoglycan/xylan/chitin deacetylase (PgdA/CDA1 family)